ncbi:MAG: response regulator transcription factor [Actinobacteria bacterium]|nr:response regulator transcription factor [Actinomycetota bacterium]
MIKVLVADDHPMIREIVREYLELFPEEFEVVAVASNGQQAVNLAAETDPDVVLMDVRMPIMDGIEATRILKAQASRGLVITYTSFLYGKVEELALQAGAVEHLLKPFDMEELRQKIKDVVQRMRIREAPARYGVTA